MADKPGYKTSELYVTCGAQVSAFVVAMSTTDTTAKICTGLIAGISLAGYLYTRYQLKSRQPAAAAKPAQVP